MCTSKPKSIPLPEQHILCSTPNSGCRYVEVKTGRKSWEKRTAVLIRTDDEPKLHIYTKPLIGRTFPLNSLKTCEAKRDINGVITMKLVTDRRMELVFKTSGNDAGLWVAAIMSCSQASLSHETHAPINDGSASNAVPNIKEEPDNNAYTGSREGYVLPVQEGSLEEKKKEEKQEANNAAQQQKSDEKKQESGKRLTKVNSKTKTKDSTTTESKRNKAKVKTVPLNPDAPAAEAVIPIQKTDSEPDNNCDPQLKKTQTETQETSGKGAGGETPNKLVTPNSTTPAGAASLTPIPAHDVNAKDEHKKTLTNSDENEVPDKKK
ncbi:hypothetical protein B9Z55_016331 [Caenorhabditis nigoni]|uniref:PH-15 domain-containing protein n=1 Tax=Caenorhabditis nigoni TaxID=1611254 RepID=A0A2G5T4P7_9PELO|nr:hypothetical protein B9Z55_016331 [Caenorhabditis nigoni]